MLAGFFATNIRKGRGEFGMWLHRQDSAVAIEKSRVRRKRRMENRRCIGGRRDDLVLMRTGDRDLLPVDHAVTRQDIIDVAPDPPALLRLGAPNSQAPGRSIGGRSRRRPSAFALHGRADEALERRDPVEIVVDAGGRSRDQDGVQPGGIGQRLSVPSQPSQSSSKHPPRGSSVRTSAERSHAARDALTKRDRFRRS